MARSPKTSPQAPRLWFAGEDDGPALVAARNELEEEVGALAIDGDVADLVDDEQRRLSRQLEPLVEPVLGQGLAEGGDEASGRRGARAHGPRPVTGTNRLGGMRGSDEF